MMKKVPVAEICQEIGVQPSVFYTWQRELFSRGAAVFEKKPGPKKKDRSKEVIESLEEKLSNRNDVIAALLDEHVALKKSLGEV